MKFFLKLADVDFEVESIYDFVFVQCSGYTKKEANNPIKVKTTIEDIENEREKSRREDIAEGIAPREFSAEYLESLALYRKISDILSEKYNTILFHGSCIAVDGKGYLFTAKSGTGKSTHTRLWRDLLGDRAVMVNDDKPLLKITDSSVIAYGTPWNGKHKLGENISVRLTAICFLNRGKENSIEKINTESFGDYFPLLLKQTHRPKNPIALSCVLSLVDSIKDKVKMYRLYCNTDISSAELSYNSMKEE